MACTTSMSLALRTNDSAMMSARDADRPAEVCLVLVAHRGDRHGDTRQVQTLVVRDRAADLDARDDAGAVDRGDPHEDAAVVDEDRVAAVRSWAPAHRAEPVSLVITDAVVRASVRAAASAPNAPPFRDPEVRIHPDGVHLSGTASAAIFRYTIRATLVPEVRDGRFRLGVTELDTGGLPGFLGQQVRDLIAQAADPAAWQLPVRISEVVLREGCGVIRGTAGD